MDKGAIIMDRKYDIVLAAVEHGMSAQPNVIAEKLDDDFFNGIVKRGRNVQGMLVYLKRIGKIQEIKGRYYKTELLKE